MFKPIGGENWTWEGENHVDQATEFEVVLKAEKEPEGRPDMNFRLMIGLPLLLAGLLVVYGLMRLKTKMDLKQKKKRN